MVCVNGVYYICIEIIIFLDTLFSNYSPWHKEFTIYIFLPSKFSDVLTTFTCVNAIGILWNICLGVKLIFFFSPKIVLYST